MSRQATKPFLHSKEVLLFFVLPYGIFVVFIENIRNPIEARNGGLPHSSLSKRRRETKSPFISQFHGLFLPVFAKQSEKVACIKAVFLFNKVDFARK